MRFLKPSVSTAAHYRQAADLAVDRTILADFTPGQRWRFRRNLAIVTLARAGFTQRIVADIFDLPHSRVAAILKEFRAKYGGGSPVSPP